MCLGIPGQVVEVGKTITEMHWSMFVVLSVK